MTGALTPDQATDLAKRIINTMRPTPPLDDWIEALTGLNADRAWRIFRHLRDTCEDGLKIATFKRLYAEDLEQERRSKPVDTTVLRTVCTHCGGTLDDHHRPTGHGCTHCRIPDIATGLAIAEAARQHPLDQEF